MSVATPPTIGQDPRPVPQGATEPRQRCTDGDHCKFHSSKAFSALVTLFLGSRTFLSHPTLIPMTDSMSEERRYQDGANIKPKLCFQHSLFLH